MPKTHPTWGSGFRQEAVNLLISSQRPLKAVAAELGVSANSLRTLVEPAAEIRRLQRENESLRRQREILKKAMSILSEVPLSGMP